MLIDEVLAVGDVEFQRKCLDRITQFKTNGCTIVLVSHDPGLVAKLCDDALWLHRGRLMAHGTADAVVERYLAETELQEDLLGRRPALIRDESTVIGIGCHNMIPPAGARLDSELSEIDCDIS